MSHRYALYGSCLGSTIEFPELRAIDGVDPRWEFCTTHALPPMTDATELGAENIYADVHARLYRHADGHRIVVDDTGSFDISPDGRDIRWEERAASWPDFVRAHLMGRVLSTSMFLDGWLPLHGSAVRLADGVVAFLAPKGFGKSSLALALTQQGAHLVTDDTLPVEPAADGTSRPFAWPGVHTLRVRDDSMLAVGADAPTLETREGKRLVMDIAGDRRAEERAPLSAIYLIDPVVPDAAPEGPARTLMSPLLAAVGVVAHVKVGKMLGASAAGPMLERAAAVTRLVPVYRLHAPRDLALLPHLAATIVRWHGGTA